MWTRRLKHTLIPVNSSSYSNINLLCVCLLLDQFNLLRGLIPCRSSLNWDLIPCRPKGSPLYYFEVSVFGWRTLILRRKSAPKKRNSKKCLKTLFFFEFFQNFACGAGNVTETVSFQCFGRAQKINLVDQKKVDSMFINFLKNRPPRENPRSAPECDTQVIRLKDFFA